MTSHLPHMAAAALANYGHGKLLPPGRHRALGYGPAGLGRYVNIWKQVLMQNRENVLKSLEQYHAQLQTLHTAIRNNDEAALERFLTTAKKNRDALGS